jgi:DNA-binding NtrC family response regulator
MESCSIRGSHPVIQSILAAAERIAGTDVGVLIVGEKGTGKELLARYIHTASPRARGPFLRFDCQDATAMRNGHDLTIALAQDDGVSGIGAALLDRARGGTLFLDHISALQADLQERLLSALLGDDIGQSDFRLVAARDPTDAVPACLTTAGLALVEIPLPALRQRRSDIPVLVDHFLALYATRHEVGLCHVDTEAMVQLWQYDWPGNVRELESVIERVVVLSRSGVVRVADLPAHIRCVTTKARSSRTPVHTDHPPGPAPPR